MAPSRPRKRPGSTRVRLLRAGRRLFARRGYDGASVRAITRAAGVNLGAITYHFGSKRAFYDAVLEDGFAPLREEVARAASLRAPPLLRVEAILRVFFRHLERYPDLPQLMLQQVAAGGRPAPPVLATVGFVLARLAAVIRDGQAEGTIREGDPLLTGISIVAQPIHFTLARRILEAASPDREGEEGPPPPFPPRTPIEEHVVTFVRRALAAPEESRP